MNLMLKMSWPNAVIGEYKGEYGIIVVSLSPEYNDAIGKFIPNMEKDEYESLDNIDEKLMKTIIASCMSRKYIRAT